jgi:hypothetical protein
MRRGCLFISSRLTKILKATGKFADWLQFFGCAPFVVFTNDANSNPNPEVGPVDGIARAGISLCCIGRAGISATALEPAVAALLQVRLLFSSLFYM